MPDYKAMYFRLFNRVSDAIAILQAAQQEGEDTFAECISYSANIKLAEPPSDEQ